MKKGILIASAAFLFGYAVFSRSQWFGSFEDAASRGQSPIYSGPIDLSKPGQVTWEVSRANWKFEEGETELSIILDGIPKGIPNATLHSSLPLRLAVSATGIDNRGMTRDRLVQNWYFTTNKPFDESAKIWASFRQGEAEYGLAGVYIYPFEKTQIKLDITSGDHALNDLHPKLKLVPKHDFAVFEVISILRIIKNSTFGLAVLCIALQFLALWKRHD